MAMKHVPWWIFCCAVTAGWAAPAAPPDATVKNCPYGPHEENVLDFFNSQSAGLTPLVVYIHGGGFRGGSKDTLDVNTLRRLLDGGIKTTFNEPEGS